MKHAAWGNSDAFRFRSRVQDKAWILGIALVNDFRWQNRTLKSLPASDSIIMPFRGQAAVIVFVYNQVIWSPIKGRQINMFSAGLLFPFVRVEHLHFRPSFFWHYSRVTCVASGVRECWMLFHYIRARCIAFRIKCHLASAFCQSPWRSQRDGQSIFGYGDFDPSRCRTNVWCWLVVCVCVVVYVIICCECHHDISDRHRLYADLCIF